MPDLSRLYIDIYTGYTKKKNQKRAKIEMEIENYNYDVFIF